MNAPYDLRKILRAAKARQCGGALQFPGRLKVFYGMLGRGAQKRRRENFSTFAGKKKKPVLPLRVSLKMRYKKDQLAKMDESLLLSDNNSNSSSSCNGTNNVIISDNDSL